MTMGTLSCLRAGSDLTNFMQIRYGMWVGVSSLNPSVVFYVSFVLLRIVSCALTVDLKS